MEEIVERIDTAFGAAFSLTFNSNESRFLTFQYKLLTHKELMTMLSRRTFAFRLLPANCAIGLAHRLGAASAAEDGDKITQLN